MLSVEKLWEYFLWEYQSYWISRIALIVSNFLSNDEDPWDWFEIINWW